MPPHHPSLLMIWNMASNAPVYCGPSVLKPATCILRRNTSNGYVRVCEMVPARPPQMSFLTLISGPCSTDVEENEPYGELAGVDVFC